ncbi:hypothetical protein ACT18_00355 [Mycolicibacter kumamotonensis]|uniref:Uncharacterized protein n=2 Tax=Mycolicibacter kumamotonensis TaxID=354243 RepID=A0A1B8SL36_9MYCO|nr:hypothetical protein ACT18_00355 [Mycolicibacter kumamotonensis]
MDAAGPSWYDDLLEMHPEAYDAFPDWLNGVEPETLDRWAQDAGSSRESQNHFVNQLYDWGLSDDNPRDDDLVYTMSTSYDQYPSYHPAQEDERYPSRYRVRDRPGSGEKRRGLQYEDDFAYYSPHDVNPESPSIARPETRFTHSEPEQPVLPGTEHLLDTDPINLYRGVQIPVGAVRALDRAQADPDNIAHDEVLNGVLDYLTNDPANRRGRGGLGTHWSTNPAIARAFGTNRRADEHSVVLRSPWRGVGEDPYRQDTGGPWRSEQEITMLPGAKMDVDQMRVAPRTGRPPFHTITPSAPRTVMAAVESFDDLL